MKKIYVLSAALLLSAATFAQTFHGTVLGTKPFYKNENPARLSCPDTLGIVNFVDFQPEYAPGGASSLIFGYSGGGYVYGNNVDGTLLTKCAQGYRNLNATPVKVTDLMVYFVAKESDLTTSASSKVTFRGYDLAPNRACNTVVGSGTYNLTVLNWDGPAATVKGTADLLFSAIDTTSFNLVTFPLPAPSFAGDFAFSMDWVNLTAGDTVGLLCDDINSAADLDLAYHYISGSYNKWMVTDNVFSATGSGDVDDNIAIFPILCDATGINEFYNGMKLTNYPNPASVSTSIEYSLENNSTDVSVVVMDVHGRKLVENKYGNQTAGTYNVNIATDKLAAGIYVYQLKANGRLFSKKFSVAK